MSVPNICLYEKKTEENHPRIPFTLKAQCKIVAVNILIFLILFLRENKAWHFMWIIY